MSYDIGPRIGIDGEAQFRSQLNAVHQSIKTLGAEMKSVTEQFKRNADSEEALTAKNQVLQKSVEASRQQVDLLSAKYEAQRAKLAGLGRELEAVVASEGENSAAAEKARRAYDQQAVAVSKAEAELHRAETTLYQTENALAENTENMQKLGDETEETGEAMDDASKKSLSFADVMKANLLSEAIIDGIKALGKAFMDVAKGIGNVVKDAAYAADDLNTMAKTTGLSTEELQKFQFASDLIDVSVDTLTGSMSKLTKNMATASKGSGDAYDAFQELGVEITGQDGMLRDRNEVFQEAVRALGEIENETQRDAYAMQIFGRSAQDLNPLILGGADALQELGQQAEDAGLILSQDGLDRLNLVSDAMDTFKATTTGAGRLFSVGIAEPIAEAVNTVTGYIQRLTSAFSQSGFEGLMAELGGVVSDLAREITSKLPTLFALGKSLVDSLVDGILPLLPEVVAAGGDILMQLASGVVETLPRLVSTAGEIIASLANGIADSLPELIPTVVDVVLQIIETLTDPESISSLVGAALQIMTGLAEGLLEAIPKIIEAVPEIIDNLIAAILDAVPLIIETGVALLVALVENLPTIIRSIVDALPEIITSIVTTLLDHIGEIVLAGVDLFLALIENLPTIIVEIVKAVPKIINALIQSFKEKWPTIKQAGVDLFNSVRDGILGKIEEAKNWGRDLIQNFINGIKQMWENLKQTVSNVAQTVKSFLGFSEPEKGPLSNFHTYAPDMMKLFAEGIRKNEKLVTDQIEDSFDFPPRVLEFRAIQRDLERSMRPIGLETASERAFAAGAFPVGGSGFGAGNLAEAIREALDGASVQMDGHKVGRLVTVYQGNRARALGG